MLFSGSGSEVPTNGAERQARYLSLAMAAQRSVFACASVHQSSGAGPLHRLDDGSDLGQTAGVGMGRLYARNLRLYAQLAPLICADGVVVNPHDFRFAPIAIEVGRVHPRVPVLVSMAGTVSGRYAALDAKQAVLSNLEAAMVRAATLVVVPEQSTGAEIGDKYGFPSARIRSVGIGVSAPPIEHLARRSHLGSSPTLLYVGRLSQEKNVLGALDALCIVRRQWRDARLVVIGTGPQETRVRKRVEELQLHDCVSLLGPKEPGEISTALLGADLCVLASTYDPYPAVVPEALVSGCPVVATPVGGVPRQLDQGRLGTVVHDTTASAIAEGVLSALAGHDAWVHRLREAQDELRARYSWAGLATRFEEAVREAEHLAASGLRRTVGR